MAELPDETQVRDWLDPDIVHSIRSVEDANAVYNLRTDHAGSPVHIIRRIDPANVIKIVGQFEPEPALLANILDRVDAKRDLRTEIAAVIAGSNCVREYLDDGGESCEFNEMRYIRFQRRIYPDGCSQDRLMNALLDVVMALDYLTETMNAFEGRIDDHR
jgi:hypothetical protein